MNTRRYTFLMAAFIILLLIGGLTISTEARQVEDEDGPPHRNMGGILEETPNFKRGFPEPGMKVPASPDAVADWSKITFESYRNNNWEIYKANGDGTIQTRLTNHSAYDIQPRLNRGATKIVFVSNRDGDYDIYMMNFDGSNLVNLSNNTFDDSNPAWSFDASRIAFQSYRDGQPEVYVMNSDGSSQTRLTYSPDFDGEPTWSPDGRQIAFTSYRNGQWRIWVMKSDGSSQVQLSSTIYSEHPVWSPDGRYIAYDADGNNDGWQELCKMNANGSYQEIIYNPPEAYTDAYASSWSPDAYYVGFTRVTYVYQNNEWRWVSAYLDYATGTNSYTRLSSNGRDWNTDWQPTDLTPPTSTMNPLPAHSTYRFNVSWYGSDSGGSGLSDIGFWSKDGVSGTWTHIWNGSPMGGGDYTGVGGHTYYFRTQAHDYAQNYEPFPPEHDTFTTVEANRPYSSVAPLPEYSRGVLDIFWSGEDVGGSGLKYYDVQYRDGLTGSWVNWQTATTGKSSSFSGASGHTYSFRSQATDNAQNVEDWPGGDGDTTTTLYDWLLSGTVLDNVERPLSGVLTSLEQGGLSTILSDTEGRYKAYGASRSQYRANWAKAGYTSLPYTAFTGSKDQTQNMVLPPGDNQVSNWGFENGLADWSNDGSSAAVITETVYHSGDRSAVLGNPRIFTQPLMLSNGVNILIGGIAEDQFGNIHITYSEIYQGLFYARRSPSGEWSTELIFAQENPQTPPQMVVAEDGAVHLVWEYAPHVYYAQRDPSGHWSTPQSVNGSIGSSNYRPLIGLDVTGVLHTAYFCYINAVSHTCYLNRSTSGVWSSPEIINNSANSRVDSIVIKGDIVHLSMDVDGHLHYVERSGDGAWSTPERVCSQCNDMMGQKMAVDDVGIVQFIWNDYIGGKWDTYYSRRLAPGSWTPPEHIAEDCYYLSFVFDSQEQPHVLCDLSYTYRRNGDGWTPVIELPHTGHYVLSTQLLIDDQDGLHIVYAGGYIRSLDDGGWSPSYPFLRPEDVEYVTGLRDHSGAIHLFYINHEVNNSDFYYTHSQSTPAGSDLQISQAITLPTDVYSPTLSFYYQTGSPFLDQESVFTVTVTSRSTTTPIFTSAYTPYWTHQFFDLSAWLGETITLTFHVYQDSGEPVTWATVDEVTVGSALPDLWVQKKSMVPGAMPGEMVNYVITYGNQGGAPVTGVFITDTLPAELTFLSADPVPDTTAPYIKWIIGDLAGGEEPYTILMTATLSTQVDFLDTISNTVAIVGDAPEAELSNNLRVELITVGKFVYLPQVQWR